MFASIIKEEDEKMRKILITGANGFVGSNICVELLRDKENLIYAIARPKGSKSGRDRVFNEISREFNWDNSDNWKERVIVLEGDIQELKLGLNDDDYKYICDNITSIYHCAASIKFSLTYDEAKKINCGGTKRIIELLERVSNKNFERLNYVSTAYISGSYIDGFKENDLNINQKFSNTYEATKFECELLLNEYINNGWPITIFRPSIVSSSSKDGSTHENNIIYKFIKFFSRQRINEFYCNETSSINIVPVDYFVKAMVNLSIRGVSTIGKTYNLVNKTNTPVKKIVTDVCKILDVKEPIFYKIDKNTEEKLSNNSLSYFFSYVNM